MSVTTMPATSETPDPAPSSRRRWIIAAVVAVLAVVGGYVYLERAGGPQEPVAGEVVALEPIQVNLSAGHYLKVGIALQATQEAAEIEGSQALDAAIALFSGRSVAELSDAEQRQMLKERLLEQLADIYDDHVMDVYFTEFVMQ